MPTNAGSRAEATPGTARSCSRPPSHAPPGFETFYLSERSKLATSFEAFVLPLHWSIVRSGLRLRTCETNPTSATLPMSELSESLPVGWKSKITTKTDEGSDQTLKQLLLRYWDHANASVHYEAKILEVGKNNAIGVILLRAVNAWGTDGNVQVVNKIDVDSSSPGRNSSATTFQLGDYLTPVIMNASGEEYSLSPAENKPWYEVYKNLQNFEKSVWEQLMNPIGLNGIREQGPYENKNRPSQVQNQQISQNQQQQQTYTPMTQVPPPQPLPPYPTGGIGGPLYNPPLLPIGAGGLGRSDLDPMGGFGAGNIADPRGFRTPGGILPSPPGARFDPFGPPNPTPPGIGPRPQPGAGTGGGNNWSVPNPDAEQPPPGFDDMFM